MVKYTAELSDEFVDEFVKLSPIHQNMVMEKIALLEMNPFHPSLRTKKLKGHDKLFESSVNMSIRMIWSYKQNRIIIMLDVGHHDVLKKY